MNRVPVAGAFAVRADAHVVAYLTPVVVVREVVRDLSRGRHAQ
jgi:hypothetical protein